MAAEEARVRTDPRFRRRRQAVDRSRRRRLFIGTTSVVALVTLVWAVFWSPLLNVRDVTVRGAEHLSADDVIQATDLIGADKNLLLLSTEEIAERVERLPWVKEADVDRMLPSSVRVSIVERSPAIVLSLGAARWTLDRKGYVLDSGETRPGLPVLAGVEVGQVEPGVRLMTPESLAALRAFRSMPSSLGKKIVGIFAPTTERITLSLQDGTVIRIGSAEKLKAKAKVLKALMARLTQKGVTPGYIDVRVPTNPAISAEPPPQPEPVTGSEEGSAAAEPTPSSDT